MSALPPCLGPEHYFVRESDGVPVCQICGEVLHAARGPAASRVIADEQPPASPALRDAQDGQS